MKYHGQYGEGEFLVKYFENNPPTHKYLVDVGAGGIAFSNTFDLLQQGWSGILIEPFPIEKYFGPLRDAFKDDPEVHILTDVAISDGSGEETAYVCNTKGWSSLLPPREEIKHLFVTVEKVRVRVLNQLLYDYYVPKDFGLLSVDAEGMDFKIISHLFAYSNYKPEIIVYEEREIDSPLWAKLFEGKYESIHKTPGNRIMRKVKT